jgi:hypothetical protein
MVWVDFVLPHLSNVDALSLKRKKPWEYIRVSPLWLSHSLPYLYCYLIASCTLSYMFVHLVAYLDNLISHQA